MLFIILKNHCTFTAFYSFLNTFLIMLEKFTTLLFLITQIAIKSICIATLFV